MLQEILSKLSETQTKLVAVSKTQPPAIIKDLYDKGQRIFGENRVQELVEKYEKLPKDIKWHFIGHLQRNKVKFIAPFVHVIHSVESLKLLKEINKQARKNARVIDCLLQFHIAQEESKFGFDMEEAKELLSSEDFGQMQHINITGVMGMGTFTTDKVLTRKEFQRLHQIFDLLKATYFHNKAYFKEISMGMSGDYLIAIEEGSTMVRIGSLIFGARR